MSWKYVKTQRKKLLIYVVLALAFNVLGMIPIVGSIIVVIVGVVFNLALIDNYLSYQTTVTIEDSVSSL